MPDRLRPEDEYAHAPGPEPTFNESVYCNVYDPDRRIGGFFRLGNRVNEGHAEQTVCLFLPDGRVGFTFDRPPIASNDAFDAGGLRFEVVEPFATVQVGYAGTVILLEDPLAMTDPKRVYREHEAVACQIDLQLPGVSSMYGGEPDMPHEPPGEEFARAHFEQLVAGTGTITVADQEWPVRGNGLRGHSWGPRSWQAPWYHRWLTANLGDGFGFMGSRLGRRDGPGTGGGFVWDGDALHLCDRCEISTTWTDAGWYHRTVEVHLGAGEREWHVAGRVLNLIPLRHRREGRTTRICEGLTEWELEDGRLGYGLSEYLDQIIDGRPVGVAE